MSYYTNNKHHYWEFFFIDINATISVKGFIQFHLICALFLIGRQQTKEQSHLSDQLNYLMACRFG